ncbi:hypothetical protein LAZ67_X003003 [Cordylochernes scorpioides]|uniref:Uncharacterized protein n=1 Tax=Cordylochernes scorpioides TaxID=51811 RepID=A0ABY6LXY3_9ARAC|nr:hypothetical protein LAZ67_X003003 [Cordylochernes scorpioides]
MLSNVQISWPCLIIDDQTEYSWREDYAVYLVGPARMAWLTSTSQIIMKSKKWIDEWIAAKESVVMRPDAQLRHIQAISKAERNPRAHPEPVGQKG